MHENDGGGIVNGVGGRRRAAAAKHRAVNGAISDDLAYLASKASSPNGTIRRPQRRSGGRVNKHKRPAWHYVVAILGFAFAYLSLNSGSRRRAVRALRRRRRADSMLRKKNEGIGGGAAEPSGVGNPYDAQDAVRAKREAAAVDRENEDQAGWKFWQRRGRKGGHGGRRDRPDVKVLTEHGVWSPNRKYRWVDVKQLPPLPGEEDMIDRMIMENGLGRREVRSAKDFKVKYAGQPPMPWEAEADDDGMKRYAATNDAVDASISGQENGQTPRHGKGITGGSNPKVDYTSLEYTYPSIISEPPAEGGYPFLESLGTLMNRWPQDDIDHPPQPIVERLQHFDYNDPDQLGMALRFRNEELPFKVYNVPEIVAAGKKWTDEYVSSQFDAQKRENLLKDIFGRGGNAEENANGEHIPMSKGHCQEAKGNFFAFFQPINWEPKTMGPPPTKDNDWTFSRWAKHARYADKVGLGTTEQHFYWQAGIPREERLQPEHTWTFVSRDLPSFSSPDPTFFGFMPEMQKGIQCRFGERGVTAATHYDAGRNMVAMMAGAKRYVLSPPNACPNLGIVTRRQHPEFRHSLLNFGYINLLDSDDPEVMTMPDEERAWLEVARDSMAVETVLKAGEVLYIPSHWFHYITSLQKSAQCNTRSGRDKRNHPEFGGFDDVMECVGEGA